MRLSRHSARKSQGYALIELIITLGIGAIMAVTVWQIYGERQALSRGTAASLAVESLIHGADASYASELQFSANSGHLVNPVTMVNLANAMDNDLPRGVERVGSTFSNQFGGTWTAGTGRTVPGGPLDLLAITTTQVPRAECQVMLGNLAPFVYDTRVNGTLVHLVPMTPADVPNRNSVDLEQGMPLCVARNTMVFRHLKEINLPDLRRLRPYGHGGLTEEEQGLDPSRSYRAGHSFLEQYNRLQAAADAREAAQAALD